MKINKLLSNTSLFLTAVISFSASSAMADQVLEYKLALAEDGKTYQMYMRPTVTPDPNISLTGQVTLRVPHEAAFTLDNVKNTLKTAEWIEASRVDAPEENPDYDYVSLSFIGLASNGAYTYDWKAGEEQLVFTFQSSAGCVEDVSVLSQDDPFNIENNSANVNIGNQFTNLGWGSVSENHYKGNYGDPIACPK